MLFAAKLPECAQNELGALVFFAGTEFNTRLQDSWSDQVSVCTVAVYSIQMTSDNQKIS